MAICRAWVTLFSAKTAGEASTEMSSGGGATSSTDHGDTGAESTVVGEGGARISDSKFAGVAGEGATETAFKGGMARAGRGATWAESA
jgi:hypothetical protein